MIGTNASKTIGSPIAEGLFIDTADGPQLIASLCSCGACYFPKAARCSNPDCKDRMPIEHRLGPTGHLHFRAALAAEFLVAALDARLLAPTALVLAFHGNLLAAGMGSNKGATASLDVPTAGPPRP